MRLWNNRHIKEKQRSFHTKNLTFNSRIKRIHKHGIVGVYMNTVAFSKANYSVVEVNDMRSSKKSVRVPRWFMF